MATLESQQFVFEPDRSALRSECEQLAKRNPSLAPKLWMALANFEDGHADVENGDVESALRNFAAASSNTVGAPELEASCYFYMGFIALAVDNDAGANMLRHAISKTQSPHLALTIYNRLMIHHLSRDDHARVIELSDATKKLVSTLPSTPATRYYAAGAAYNRAEACFRQGEFARALPHVRAAAAEFGGLSLWAEAAKCEGMLGNALVATGDISGLDHIEKSLTLFRSLGNDGEVAFLLQGKGLAMAKLGRKDDAIKCLREALRIFKKRKEVYSVNSTLAVLANLED
jgi:tetratricopeptide (TPR) repeat protein